MINKLPLALTIRQVGPAPTPPTAKPRRSSDDELRESPEGGRASGEGPAIVQQVIADSRQLDSQCRSHRKLHFRPSGKQVKHQRIDDGTDKSEISNFINVAVLATGDTHNFRVLQPGIPREPVRRLSRGRVVLDRSGRPRGRLASPAGRMRSNPAREFPGRPGIGAVLISSEG